MSHSTNSTEDAQLLSKLQANFSVLFNKSVVISNAITNPRYAPKLGLEECDLFFKTPKWDDEDMQRRKKSLNDVKNLLDHLNIDTWSTHTKQNLLTSDIVRSLRDMHVEMPTIAWAKMFEMIAGFELVTPVGGTVMSVHLCEAPGAFIASTNHYIRCKYPQIQWNWRAVTLNPYHESNFSQEMIEDDGLILRTFNNWLFGGDNTGDIRVPDNLNVIASQIMDAANKAHSPVMMVTADGSIDCQDEPNEQERIVAELHLCEAICALSVLHTGGNFVLKMFTLFEEPTICLLYLLSAVFEQVSVTKPATSKAGNSETYIVCKRFKKIQDDVKKAIIRGLIKSKNQMSTFSMLPRATIGEQFLHSVRHAASQFAQWQEDVMTLNMSTFTRQPYDWKRTVFGLKKEAVRIFKDKYGVIALDQSHHLVPYLHLDGVHNSSGFMMSRTKTGGTLEDRQTARAEERRAAGIAKRTIEDSRTLGDGDGNGANVGDGGGAKRSAVGDEDDIKPSLVKAPDKAPAMRMMEAMGYVDGAGLGVDNQGMTDNVKMSQRNQSSRLGLGAEPKISVIEDSRTFVESYTRQPDIYDLSLEMNEDDLKRLTHQFGDKAVDYLADSGENLNPLRGVMERVIQSRFTRARSELIAVQNLASTARLSGAKALNESPLMSYDGLPPSLSSHPWASFEKFSTLPEYSRSLAGALAVLNDVSITMAITVGCDIDASVLPLDYGDQSSDQSSDHVPTDQLSTPLNDILRQYCVADAKKDVIVSSLLSCARHVISIDDAPVSFSTPWILLDPLGFLEQIDIAGCESPSTRPLFSELDRRYRISLVWQLLCATTAAQPGTCVCMRAGSAVTRFGAGMLWLLTKCFRRVRIVRSPTSPIASDEMFVVCEDMLDDPPLKLLATIIMYEIRSIVVMKSANPSFKAVGGYGVIEIVDIRCLHYHYNFWYGLVNFNERLYGDMLNVMKNNK